LFGDGPNSSLGVLLLVKHIGISAASEPAAYFHFRCSDVTNIRFLKSFLEGLKLSSAQYDLSAYQRSTKAFIRYRSHSISNGE